MLAALAVAGAAFAAGADSNVVGYVTKGLEKNQKLQSGAQFVECGDVELDISSIILEGVPTGSEVSIEWWNGVTYVKARWNVLAGLMDTIPNPHLGWVKDGTLQSENHTFAPGEGFWIVIPASGVGNMAQVKIANQVDPETL